MAPFRLIITLIVTGVIFTSGIGGKPAFAQGNPLYTVKGISVDVEGEDAVDAREKALAAGGRIALRQVAKRLTSGGELPKLKRSEVEELILNYLVESEKSSNTRYVATLTYELEAEAVRALFKENGITFSETQSEPLLVLPVWQTAAGSVLFRSNNPWKAAWDAAGLAEGTLLPILSALGDLHDSTLMPAAKAQATDQAAIKAIAEKYETGKVLLITAAQASDDKITIKGSVYGLDGTRSDGIRLTVQGQGQLRQATRQVHASLLRRWKEASADRDSEVTDAELGATRVAFQIRNFSHWRQLQAALDTQPVVRRYDVIALSKSRAILSLRHSGSVQRLIGGLRQKSLQLMQDENRDVWWIYFRSDGPPAAARQPVQTPIKETPTQTSTQKTSG